MRFIHVFSCSFAIFIFFQVIEFENIIKLSIFGLAIFFIISIFINKNIIKVAVLLLITSVFSVVYFNNYYEVYVKPVKLLSDRAYKLTAVVAEYPNVYEDTSSVILHISDDKIEQDFKTLCYFDDLPEDIKPGDEIYGWYKFYKPSSNDGFDRSEYYDSKGIFIASANSEILEISYNDDVDIKYLPQIISEYFKDNSVLLFGEYYGGVVNSIIFGDKSQLDETLYDDLKTLGISHIIAVSGLHIGFLVSSVMMIFGKKAGTILALVAILIFVPMTGMTPSAMRAGIMYFILAIAWLTNRRSDGKTSLYIALSVILLLNPYSIMSISLQLSFLATFGLLTFGRSLKNSLSILISSSNRIISFLQKFVIASISCSFGAMVFTTPIIMLEFSYIAILAPIANIFAIPLISIIFPLGIIALLTYTISPIFSLFISNLAVYLIDFLIFFINTLLKVPIKSIYTDTIYAILFIVCVYIVFSFLYIIRREKFTKYIALFMSVLFVFISITVSNLNRDAIKVMIFPCGTSQTVMLSKEDKCVLIDCAASGTRYPIDDIREYMEKWGHEHIDLVLISSLDKTHASHLPELIETIPFEDLVHPINYIETEFTVEIFETMEEHEIINSSLYDISDIANEFKLDIYTNIDRKLVIFCNMNNETIMFSNALTQNMFIDFMSKTYVPCDTIIASSNLFEQNEKLSTILKTSPENIIINSYTSNLPLLDDARVMSPIIEGNIEIIEKDN